MSLLKSSNRAKHAAVLFLAFSFVTACADSDIPTVPSGTPRESRSISERVLTGNDTITRYIVRLKASPVAVGSRATAMLEPHGGKLSIVFNKVFQGFVAEGLTPAAAALLAKNPLVEYVEKEGVGTVDGVQTLTEPSQWGLDRIDQRPDDLDNQYTYAYTGAGVHIYIMDTGVRGGHVDFAGRMGSGACKLSWSWGCSHTIDPNGHGTAVASIAAGTIGGVAKEATIHSVRVVEENGNFRDGDLIDGLEWVLSDYQSRPAVVSISLGCNCAGSFAVRDAMQVLINNGINVVKSAGNYDRDAFDYRPNRASPMLVVGAAGRNLNQTLYRLWYSNFGTTVDLFAPGDSVYAASNASNTSYITDFDGTSAATPFAAGAVAQILSAYPYLTPTEVEHWIKSNSTPGVVSNTTPNDPNLFLSRW